MSRNLVQYVRKGSGFVPIGETIQALEPGRYDIVSENNVLVFARRATSTDKLLRLPDSKSDAVISEIEKFWARKARFDRYGLVHKRGFLLWGPPGGGKTSTIEIVADSMIAAGGLVINGNSAIPANLKRMLHDLREVEPERPIVVTLEDIENLLRQGESDLLALLDGDASIGNAAFIATTNYPEKLEARIINRPSRFDMVVRIGMPSRQAREQYLRHADPEIPAFELEAWLDATEDLSIAQLKEVVVGVRCFDHAFDEVVGRLRAGSLNITSEKLAAKQARNRTFFEKFYAACEAEIPAGQMKAIRDKAVGGLGGSDPAPKDTPTRQEVG